MYSSKLTAALTGASMGQLAYWRRRDASTDPILAPEYGTEPRALYSYADVVALRMFVRLRRDTSLQKVRRAVDTLRRESPQLHMAAHRLEATGRTIVWLTNGGDYVDVVENPGQPGIPVIMEEVFAAYTTSAGRRVPPLATPAPGLSIDHEIRHGYPVVAGTRIPYDTIAGLAHDGLTTDEIIAWYPDTPVDAVQGAIDLAELVDGQATAA